VQKKEVKALRVVVEALIGGTADGKWEQREVWSDALGGLE
jgi:hypothetical protein